MGAPEILAYLTGGAGFLTAVATLVNNARKPDKTVELLNAAISDAIGLRQQVQTLFASSTQAFQEGLGMRGAISDLQDQLAERDERIAILEAHDNRTISELKADNHRLRTQIVEYEYRLAHGEGGAE